MFEALGSHTYRFRFLIVAAWIVAAILSFKLAPSIASQGTADQASFLPPSAPSAVAQAAIARAFPGSTSSSSATLTFSRDTGALTDADGAAIQAFAGWVRSADAPQALRDAVASVDTATSRPELKSMLRSSDGQLEMVLVNLDVSSAGDEAAAVVSALRAHAASLAPTDPGLAIHVTGSAGITTDYLQAIKDGTASTTAVTIILVLAILLLIYRAPLAALVPLATIGAAFVVARGVLGVLAAAGWQISSLLDTFVVVLVFGVGTDYTIFLISRYREEVRGGNWHHASRLTVRRIGAVISASAATVIVGLGAMAFGEFEMIRSTGPALAVAIAVTLGAGLTLAPALLAIFGHYLFWPLHERTGSDEEPTGFFARLADVVTRHPGLVTAAIVVALAIPAAFVPQMRTNFDTLAELPSTSDARAGYAEVAAHLGKGKIVQSTGLIDAGPRADILAPASLAELRDTVAELSKTAGVGSVTSLVTPNGDGVVPDAFKPSVQLKTIAGSFASSSGGSGSSSGGSTSLADPKVAAGLSDALDYVQALGLTFPDVVARAEFRTATKSLEDAQAILERATAQSVVSSQLRTLASALTSPAMALSASAGGASPSGGSSGSSAGGSSGSSDAGLVAAYLDELAASYPEVRTLPAFEHASAAAASLKKARSAGAAVDAAAGLDALAIHFDSKPDATLAAKSLSNTPTALEAKRLATAAFGAIPTALSGLAGTFTGRSDDLFVPVGLGGSNATDLEKAVDAFVSADRSATRFYLTASDDPYNTSAFNMIRTVQDDLAAAAPAFGAGATAAVDGPTAQLADVQTVLERDFERVGIITVLGILVVLVLLLRAIVAPLYLVATVLLSYGSALGLSAWLFQGPLGQPGVSFYLPLLVFVLLVALGSDYNIFLMSRVREESETRPIRDGIRLASGHTGAVITSAGLILAGTFGSMASAPLAVLFQIGLAVAIGVLIDTFVVRSILVPAITTVVGDRAWWPSGLRLGGLLAPPAAGPAVAVHAASGSGVVAPASSDALPGAVRSARTTPLRILVAVLLAALVPVTFAGLIVWARPAGASPAVHAAVVDGDEGATITAGDGTTQSLRLGADLLATLTARRTADPLTWKAADATTASAGLADGTFDAVLTIPAGYSRAVAALQGDRTGGLSGPTLHLATNDASGAASQEVARSLSAAVSSTASRGVTASYVGDLLLAVSSTRDDVRGAATRADDLATRTSTLASDASGIGTVAGELVSGLQALASGTAGAVDGAAKLATGTGTLTVGAKRVADGAASLSTGASSAAAGASSLSSGAASLADGLSTLKSQTSGLPGQAAALDSGAASLTSGAASAASGAASLSAGLATLKSQTTGLGAQVSALDSGAADLASGATSLSTGASASAAGASTLATNATAMAAGVDTYAASVASLAANCAAMGGGPLVCPALTQIALTNPTVTAGADGVAAGAAEVATGAAGVASGASDLVSGAANLHAGTQQLASGAPALESGIADSAAGASSLSTGTAGVASGASALAAGTHRLAAGMPALADGVSTLSAAAASVSAGASSLAAGVSDVASGATALADGAKRTASGAASLAAASASSAAGSGKLSSAVGQAVDAGRLVDAQAGQLAKDGTTLTSDASKAASSLDSVAASAPSYPDGTRTKVASDAATPVSVETVAASAPAGLAPYVAALGLWLGALAALVVVPSGRGRRGRRGVASVALAFLGTSALALVAAMLMVLGLLLVGLSVARLPELIVVCAVAALAFVAVVEALVVAFGRRGWLLALLLAFVQVAASGLLYPADALPGPLAFLHPLLPLSWASDAFSTSIGGGSGGIGEALVVLAAWLVGALLATFVVVGRPEGPEATAGLGRPRRPQPGTAAA